jgi:CheY-like chemotaxis protein/anti-anti-sigma regulatory factor
MAVATKRRLLIVDDETEIRETLAQYFSRLGYRVDMAADGSEALGKLPNGFEAMLADIRMPGMDGIDLLQQARRLNPGIGVFLITGYPSLDTLVEAKQYGAVAYFRKPLRLMEIDSQLRAFLGEDATSLIAGRVLVVGEELEARVASRLSRFQVQGCQASEVAFLNAVRELRPKAVLADAADAATPALLREYQKQAPRHCSFLLVCSDASLDAANELLFGQGATGCIPLEAPQEVFEQLIKEAVEQREAEPADRQGRIEALAHKCTFAKAYRNGYYCMSQGGCPFGPYRGGWIAIEGKEFQKCLKRPLLVDSLESVGMVAWEGRIEAARTPELRRQLLELVRERKHELIIDAQGLEAAHVSLFEVLTDVHAELRRGQPDGVIHIINLPESLLAEFTKVTVDTGIRCSGPRMVDQRSNFERWGSRFD